MDASNWRSQDYLTVRDISKILSLHNNTVYELLSSREIPSIKIGTTYRIPCAGFQQWLKDKERMS